MAPPWRGFLWRLLRRSVEKDPKAAAEPLDYVRSLNETGLAEMRALIFELRPESLKEEGLNTALQKQLAAAQARHHLKVEAALCEEIEAPLEVKEDACQRGLLGRGDLRGHGRGLLGARALVDLLEAPQVEVRGR